MAKKPTRDAEILNSVRAHLQELHDLVPGLTPNAARRVRRILDEVRDDIGKSYGRLDPIQEPTSLFDPANPETAGRLVALALLAQPRTPLDLIAPSYGCGIYAIYYTGDHPLYTAVTRTETPLYVGKADPRQAQARTAREQGTPLYGRLKDHRKAIRKVEEFGLQRGTDDFLCIQDFECRRLVTATNAQLSAEQHLIKLFEPLWNSETKICWGISMHGDTTARSNSRPPWHTVHPGVSWATDRPLEDARSPERIREDVAKHFEDKPPFKSREAIIDRFLAAFAQDPITAEAPVADTSTEDED